MMALYGTVLVLAGSWSLRTYPFFGGFGIAAVRFVSDPAVPNELCKSKLTCLRLVFDSFGVPGQRDPSKTQAGDETPF